jgi:hypothetical protein
MTGNEDVVEATLNALSPHSVREHSIMGFRNVGKRLIAFFAAIAAFLTLSILTAVLSALIDATSAQPTTDRARSLKTLWEIASPGAVVPAWRDIAQSAAESATILIEDDARKNGLLVGSNRAGPGRLVPLPVSDDGLRLISADNTLWVGGATNQRRATFGGMLSDAYLAKLDLQGRIIWERTFGARSERELRDMAALPDGDIVVVGGDNQKVWLARISANGQLIWERTFGLSWLASVAVIGNTVFVAAFGEDERRQDGAPSRNVSIWRFDIAGRMLGQHRIHTIGEELPKPFWFMKLLVGPAGDIYFFSSWEFFSTEFSARNYRPVFVKKLDMQGRPIWNIELTQSALQGNPTVGARPTDFCRPKLILLQSGNPFISCATAATISFTELSSTSGEADQFILPQVSCNGLSVEIEFMMQVSEENIWTWGRRRDCVWLGQLTLRSQ